MSICQHMELYWRHLGHARGYETQIIRWSKDPYGPNPDVEPITKQLLSARPLVFASLYSGGLSSPAFT